MVTVAMAPWTTSMRMMNSRNSRSAVQQPKKPQKMRRAKASRNVSRTSASVALIEVAFILVPSSLLSLRDHLLWFHGLHENFFQCASRPSQGFDLAAVRAQQIDRLI